MNKRKFIILIVCLTLLCGCSIGKKIYDNAHRKPVGIPWPKF